MGYIKLFEDFVLYAKRPALASVITTIKDRLIDDDDGFNIVIDESGAIDRVLRISIYREYYKREVFNIDLVSQYLDSLILDIKDNGFFLNSFRIEREQHMPATDRIWVGGKDIKIRDFRNNELIRMIQLEFRYLLTDPGGHLFR